MKKRKEKSNVWVLGVFFGIVLGLFGAGTVIYKLTDHVSVENASKIADPHAPRVDESAIQLDGLLNELEDAGPIWQEPERLEISPDVQSMIVGSPDDTRVDDLANPLPSDQTADPLDELVAAITAPSVAATPAPNPSPKQPPLKSTYSVQAGAFSTQDEAKKAINHLGLALFDPRIEKVSKAQGKVVYRVMLGPYGSEQDAKKIVDELNTKGIPSFITL